MVDVFIDRAQFSLWIQLSLFNARGGSQTRWKDCQNAVRFNWLNNTWASDSIGSKRTLLPSYEVGSMKIQICRNVEMLNAAFFLQRKHAQPRS